MKPVTEVPEAVRPVHRRLAKKYRLGFETVTVGGKTLEVLGVADLEPLIGGRDVFANPREFPFWVKIWEASVVLADFLAALPPDPGRRLLELGAGLGVTGLAGAAFGHRVTLTDYQEEILDFGRVSAAVNGCADRAAFEVVDWLAPRDLGRFDVLLGSEVLFNEQFFEPLLGVFRRYLAPGGVVYLAHDARRRSLGQFLPLCERDYRIGMKRRRLRTEDETLDVLLTRLEPR
ncbi:methyltransferase domain-containing protein [Dissulfurirhabdus thermomarina]|uniref:Methyltransferase domain-containing protein n=1 Tax=Dissulfurirhabdus thermomarina TaxID=1765737 RepID=A0A6N9TUZ1_DISTH|nr:methyltransferase domain-containing protein [Dissulfurirhabdus thermomarina]NDY42326.1 methyltransferase domain-containing protein [Dissulfurirhabdus thermomarina]NMX23393.1 methyltransferase domain-containing protein [Dissulfurirhabdus thermomarina]